MYSFGLHAYESAEEESSSAAGNVPANARNQNQFYQYPAAPAPRANPNATTLPTTPATTTRPSSPTRASSPPPARRPVHYVVDTTTTQEFDLEDDDIPQNPGVLNRTMLTTLLAGLHSSPLDISIRPFLNDRTNNLNSLTALANLLLRSENAFIPNMEPVIVRPTEEQIAGATLLGNPDSDHDCAVCQDIISSEQQGRKINHCGHWFHKDCIDPWFQQNVQCPVCRYDIRETTQGSQQQQQQQQE